MSTRYLDLTKALDDEMFDVVIDVETALHRAASALSEGIYLSVPNVSRDVRRIMLAARRRTKKWAKIRSEDARILLGNLQPQLIRDYQDLVDRHSVALERINNAIIEDTELAATLISAAVNSREVRDALSVTSSSNAVRLAEHSFRPGGSAVRAALNYAIRSTLKPSPLSTFASVSFSGSIATNVVSISPLLDIALADAAICDSELCEYADLRPISYRSIDNGDVALVLERFNILGGISPAIRDISAVMDDLLAIQRGLASLSIQRRQRLYFSGLMIIDHEDYVRNTGRRNPQSSKLRRLSESRRALDDICETLEEATGGQRVDVMREFEAQVREMFEILGAHVKPKAQLYEFSFNDYAQSPSTVGGARLRQYRTLSREILHHTYRSRAYELLSERVSRFGTQIDAEEFVLRASTDKDFMQGLRLAWANDASARPDGKLFSEVATGPGMMRPAAIVAYQDTSDESMLVLNNIFPMSIGLLARYAAPKAGGNLLTAEIETALRQLAPEGAVLIAVLPNRRLSPLHSDIMPSSTLLSLDGPENEGDSVPLSDLMITYDLASRSMSLQTNAGRNVVLNYWGVAPHWTYNDVIRIVLTIANPWVVSHPVALRGNPYLRSIEITDGPERYSRLVNDGVVFRRAGWRVVPSEIPNRGDSESDVSYVIAVDAWRRERALPTEVFVTCVGTDLFSVHRRKPFWASFRSLVSLLHMEEMCKEATALWLEEVLPTRDDGDGLVSEVLSLIPLGTHDDSGVEI